MGKNSKISPLLAHCAMDAGWSWLINKLTLMVKKKGEIDLQTSTHPHGISVVLMSSVAPESLICRISICKYFNRHPLHPVLTVDM